MVGGSDFEDSPFNLATNGHRQPGSAFKPFTLVTALQQGRSTGEVFTSAPQEIPFQVKVPKNERQRRQGRQRPLPRQQLQRLLPRLGLDRDRDHLLGQLGLLAARHPGRGRERRRDGERDGDRDRPRRPSFDYSINDGPWHPYNPALILGGLETGVTPLEMTHAYNTLAADGRRLSGHDGGQLRRPGRRSSRSPTATTPTDGDLVPDQTGAERRERARRPAGDRPDRRPDRQGRALDRGHLGHRSARSEQRADLGQDRDHRRQRRRLVLRRDDEVHRLHLGRLPRHGHPDGDRVRRAHRSTAAPSRR